MDTKRVAITLMVITIALTAVSLAADLGESDSGVQSQGSSDTGSQANVAFSVESPNNSGNDSPSGNTGGTQ
ncbi:MAG: hypothetical protein ABEI74_01610 [Candidatus Pacearchaeota archaeon]